MIKSLLLVKKMVTKLNKKNPFKKELFTKKFKLRILKSKKGKGSFSRSKKLNNYSLFQFLKLGKRCSILVVSLATNTTSPEIDILSKFVLI